MKMKPMDYLELPAKVQHDADTRRFKEMCGVALTALSYVDIDRLNDKQSAQYATAINELRRLKMEFEYS